MSTTNGEAQLTLDLVPAEVVSGEGVGRAGWRTQRVEDIVEDIQTGFACGRHNQEGDGIAHLRPMNVSAEGRIDMEVVKYVPRTEANQQERLLRSGDVLFNNTNSPDLVGKTALYDLDESLAFSNHMTRLRCQSERVLPSYLATALHFKWKQGYFKIICNNHVSQASISRAALLETKIEVPPVEEQARIVARLEALLGRVRRTQARLDGVPALARRLREAVLAAACSGRLTEDWRDAHPPDESEEALLQRVTEERRRRWADVLRSKGRDPEQAKYPAPLDANPDFANELEADLPDVWALASMDALTSRITSGPRGWSKYYRDEAPSTFIMAQNVRPLQFDRSTRQPVDPPANDSSRERCEARQDDLLVTIVGANTGDVCRIAEPVEEHFVCQSVALMRPVLPETSQYLELYLNSVQHGQGQYRAWMYGEGRPHLNFEQLKTTAVALPPLAEQREIVRRAERLLALADAVERRARTARAQTERLAQAVLDRAFSGKLVNIETAS